jgi:D-alanine-D-alanine ligase
MQLTNRRAWYEESFGDDYVSLYAGLISEERTRAEVSALIDLMQLLPGCSALDVGCGYGRHALHLARRGFEVTGLDLSGTLLREAAVRARAEGLSPHFVQADMRRIPMRGVYDAAISMYTSFGYFDDDEQDVLTLKSVWSALQSDGIFVLETINFGNYVRVFEPYAIVRYDDGRIAIEERTLDLVAGRVNALVTVIDPLANRVEHEYSIRLYTVTELTSMIRSAGFQVEGVFGGLERVPITMESRRLVVLARRRIGPLP